MKMLLLTGMLLTGIIFFSQCFHSGVHDPRGKGYAGSASCRQCHMRIFDDYAHTAHFHSAALASPGTIEGSFAHDSNTFEVNDTTKVVMEERGGVPYQVLYCKGVEKRAEPFDIVFGYSKGQSYLYWKNDNTYQLPISWLTGLRRWTSSPGYPSGMPFFDRPVLERCFECHTTFITGTGREDVNALDKRTLIAQIDCERCHGPAASHVSYHLENPGEKQGRFIVSYKSLTRERRIDACAICHAGSNTIQLRSIFGFRPGDSLSHFMVKGPLAASRPDVHGDQIGLLASSKCFKMSAMDCSTCHDPHINDHGEYATYAQRCQDCHTAENHNFCKLADSRNIAFLEANCTRCHMPAQASAIIQVKTAETNLNTAIYMVNHRIAVYREESKKILQSAGFTISAAPAY